MVREEVREKVREGVMERVKEKVMEGVMEEVKEKVRRVMEEQSVGTACCRPNAGHGKGQEFQITSTNTPLLWRGRLRPPKQL